MATEQAPGLTQVPDAALVRLLRVVWRDQLTFPISRAGLLLARVGSLDGQLEVLIGQSKSAAVAILSAVLHERRRRGSAQATRVVWSGPPPSGADALRADSVLAELIATAERSLLFTGADLRRDERALRSMHAAQRGRALALRVVLAAGQHDDRTHLSAQVQALFHGSGPAPAVYVPDPAQLRGELPMCLVADGERAVVFAGTPPELESDEGSVTAGLSITDAQAASALEAQWQSLIDSAALVLLSASIF
jgi:hypothetical protein